MKNKKILIIAHEDFGKTTCLASEIIVAHKLPTDTKVINLNETSLEKAKKTLEELYPDELKKQTEFIIKPIEKFKEPFIERPRKPKYNPKTGKTKY
jgi:hypothetical protein